MNTHLIFGVLWLGLFFAKILLSQEKAHWLDYGWLLIAALYLGAYLYQKKNGYLSIEDGVLRIHDVRRKQMNLEEVTQFRYFAGDYILESATQKIKINTHYLDAPSLQRLKTELAKHGLEPGYTKPVQAGTE